MQFIRLRKTFFRLFSLALIGLFVSSQAQALVCLATPPVSGSLKGTWIDKIRPFDGRSTYKFVVSYVDPKLESKTTCQWFTKNGGFPSFGIVKWQECTTTEKCVPGYFQAVFTLDQLAAQNSFFDIKLKGVENGTWVSFDHKYIPYGETNTEVKRYWLQPTSDKNKATFVIWSNPDTHLIETWKDPLTRAQ